jgi:uncharacterized membrane-anchored protein YjiN (DUF445 family)
MTHNKLREDLDKLRVEIDNIAADDHKSKDKLNQLIFELESRLESSDEEDNQGITQNVKEAINQFETEHPRATAILNDIMVTLSNIGI